MPQQRSLRPLHALLFVLLLCSATEVLAAPLLSEELGPITEPVQPQSEPLEPVQLTKPADTLPDKVDTQAPPGDSAIDSTTLSPPPFPPMEVLPAEPIHNDMAPQAVMAMSSELQQTRDALKVAQDTIRMLRGQLQTLQSAYGKEQDAHRKAANEHLNDLYSAQSKIRKLTEDLGAAEEKDTEQLARLKDQARRDAARIEQLEREIAEINKVRLISIQRLPNDQTRIRLSSDRLFSADRLTLSAEGQVILNDVAAMLDRSSARYITVEAHVDDDTPFQGTGYRSLHDLTRRQAQQIVGYFRLQTGLLAQRFQPRGMGAARPVASRKTTQGQSYNRRIDILLEANRPLLPMDQFPGRFR